MVFLFLLVIFEPIFDFVLRFLKNPEHQDGGYKYRKAGANSLLRKANTGRVLFFLTSHFIGTDNSQGTG